MRGFCLTFLFLGACGGASKPPDLGAGADLSGSPADLSASSSDLAGSPSDAAQPGDASQSGGGTVTLQVYNLDNNPGATFVMFEDGDGPWSALAATSPGLYTLHVTDGQGRYSFAAGDITQAPYARGFLLRAAVADGATQSVYFSPDQPTPNVSVSDTVAGIVSGDSVELEAGPGSLGSFVTSGSQTGLLAPGTYDFFAHKYTGATPGPIIYRPNVAISPSPSPAPSFSFDFGSAEPVALQSFAATVHGVPPGAAPQVETDLVLHDSLSQDGVGPLSRSPSGGTMGDAAGDYAFAMQLLPSPSPQPTQLVIASAFLTQSESVRRYEWIDASTDRALTLPPRFKVTHSSFGGGQPSLTWNAIPGATAYHFDLQLHNSSAGVIAWTWYSTPAGLSGANTATFPSLSGVSGWDASFTPTNAGGTFQGAAFAAGSLDRVLHQTLNGPYKAQAGDSFVSSIGPTTPIAMP